MTKPRLIKSNQFILVSGLHTFSLPITRDACNLKIFLDIDEDLRRFFKIRRDVQKTQKDSYILKNLMPIF